MEMNSKIEVESLAEIAEDCLLVEALRGPEKIGSIHMPETVKDRVKSGRGRAWRGRVVKMGAGIDKDRWGCYTVDAGDVVVLTSESIECPSFDGPDGLKYVFVRDIDVLAKEVREV